MRSLVAASGAVIGTLRMAKRAPPELTREDTVKRRHLGPDEEEAMVDGVFLNEESLTQISRLFKIIDRNSDGKLDIQDFSLGGAISDTHFKKWQEVRDKFDYDGDGQVTMEEFRRGFKKMVLRLGCTIIEVPSGCTIEGYLRAMEQHVNNQVQELCKNAFIWYSSSTS